jgi:hypothetical protein
VPTKPSDRLDPLLRLCGVRLRELRLCELRLCELRLWLRRAVAPLERFEPLLEREEALRVERAFAPEELAFARLLDAEAPDDLLLLCLLPEVFLLAATAHPSSV